MGESQRTPDVSVVIPTRNRRGYALQAARGALAQRGVDVEVVVVDDGSEDGTADCLAQNIDDERLRVIRHRQSQGVGRARNRGIEAARGAWTAFLDDDDLWSPDKLRLQLKAAVEARSLWAYGAAGTKLPSESFVRFDEAPEPGDILSRLARSNLIPAGASNVVCRTATLRRVGGFDPRFQYVADWDLWIRLARESTPAMTTEMVVIYRRHPENMAGDAGEDPLTEYQALLETHAKPRDGADWAPHWFVRWVAASQRRFGDRKGARRVLIRGGIKYRDLGSLARATALFLGEPAMRSGKRLLGLREIAPKVRPVPAWADDAINLE
jgi:glycosyltransferase involved in cell wall biosynthesis